MQTLRRAVIFNYAGKQTARSIAVKAAVANDKRAEIKPWQDIPGPSSLPIIGQLHHFLPGGFLHLSQKEVINILYEKYGPIVKMKFLGLPALIVHVTDAEAIEQILRGEDALPDRPAFKSLEYYRKEYNKNRNPSECTGLVTERGEDWKRIRTKVNPIMLQPKRVKLYSKILDEVSEDMITKLKSKLNEKNMVQGGIRNEVNLWSLEAVAVVALGKRLNCFDPNLPQDSPVRKLIKNVHEVFHAAEELDLKPSLWRYYPTKMFKKAMKIYEEQSHLTRYFIKERIEQLKQSPPRNDDEKSILEKLLDIDENTAHLMAGDSLFAGVDTVANVMISIFYYLATNIEKQNRLREEIMSGDPKQPYLKACIKETLRLIPVVPGNLRKLTKDYNILGYQVPIDTFAILNHEVLCKQDKHFPRANEFIPERWIVEKTDPLHYSSAHPFVYNPFGFGTRSCIGRRIAQLEMESFVHKMFRSFHLQWHGPPAKVDVAISNYIIGDLPFTLKEL
ncbi:cytochrome P450 CYP12A2-like isoform X2 [Zerene cesonia]|uniref:cytochrome P450 CYP12A2-like isoform X2 n=1 Tax=Zerene cesonia TaxID=33412 RepID=UPI0018E53275|nr:cytochrome P450 CYP12A2-like isoform X2 [Zerene cesonia]